ncbi:Hypothetical predicted protein [Cloeon dipterum]|uniref:Metalloendopeptidase n=1 Tax=Cloeon dipterum TaxID=197152 RepID=A0A8S1BQX6_9INSE|nr:Hypothetical predicted protein [Cloeon dipterum]
MNSLSFIVLPLLAISIPSLSAAPAPGKTAAKPKTTHNDDKIGEEFRDMQLESWVLNHGLPEPKSGINLDRWNASSANDRPEERGFYLEGDILYQTHPSATKSAQVGEYYKWPNAQVFIKISGAFAPHEVNIIKKATQYIEKHTCIRFFFYQPGIQKDYVDITNSHTGCFSSVGRTGGRQVLNLQSPQCVNLRTATHELIHSLGFFHEQSRSDRDKYIQIEWGNIHSHEINNFKRHDNSNHQGLAYDFQSIMHYSRFAFARNPRLPTIRFKPPYEGWEKVAKNDQMTWTDVEKINKLYKCPSTSASPTSS